MVANYVNLKTLEIISHVAFQRENKVYKSIPFPEDELLEFGAAPLDESGPVGFQSTGKAVLINGNYYREYRQQTQEEVSAQKLYKLRETDSGFVRVVEDLIAALISNDTISLNDLPQFARDRIQERKDKRANL